MIGAGSVVFARTLMSDILSFPELAEAPHRAASTSTRGGSRPPR